MPLARTHVLHGSSGWSQMLRGNKGGQIVEKRGVDEWSMVEAKEDTGERDGETRQRRDDRELKLERDTGLEGPTRTRDK